mmetsp:Transcript_13862/g.35745  ORF Transcript_13862/g.35745 Transcript_13862/m.35745 type:complete len:223 (-) Transcript_13862:619-1287(-)
MSGRHGGPSCRCDGCHHGRLVPFCPQGPSEEGRRRGGAGRLRRGTRIWGISTRGDGCSHGRGHRRRCRRRNRLRLRCRKRWCPWFVGRAHCGNFGRYEGTLCRVLPLDLKRRCRHGPIRWVGSCRCEHAWMPCRCLHGRRRRSRGFTAHCSLPYHRRYPWRGRHRECCGPEYGAGAGRRSGRVKKLHCGSWARTCGRRCGGVGGVNIVEDVMPAKLVVCVGR